MNSWPPNPNPERNPVELWTFGLLAATMWSIAFGLAPLPQSLKESPDPFGQTSALLMWVGAIIAFLGLVWPKRWRYIGLRLEQVGSVATGVALFMYAVAIGNLTNAFTNGLAGFFKSPGLTPMMLCFALAFGLLWRVAQINGYMERRRRYETALAAEANHLAANPAEQGG